MGAAADNEMVVSIPLVQGILIFEVLGFQVPPFMRHGQDENILSDDLIR